MEKDWALSVDQCWLQALQFSAHLIDLLGILLRYNGFARIQKAAVDKTGSRLPNSDHDLFFFFWCEFGCEKCFGASSWSNRWADHCWLSYKTYFSSHVTIRLRNDFLLLCTVREDDASKQWSLWFSVSSWGTHLSNFFSFPTCFKCQTTIEWSMLNSWATSHIESALMMFSVGCCHLLVAGHYTLHLQDPHLLCKTSWTTTTLNIH